MISDLLSETKSFKHQITVKFLLKEYKFSQEIEFAPVYFNWVRKTVINHILKLECSFQEMLCLIDVLVSKESGWNIESIESQYINIFTFKPLSESSYMNLLAELKSPRKWPIKIKNKDQKFMNSSIDKLVKNLSDEDFRYIVQEFGSKNLRLLKKRCLHLQVYEQF